MFADPNKQVRNTAKKARSPRQSSAGRHRAVQPSFVSWPSAVYAGHLRLLPPSTTSFRLALQPKNSVVLISHCYMPNNHC